MTNIDTKTLQSLKVPELKAKCKELKILNYSKLSKADLILKILEADPDKTNAPPDNPLETSNEIESASRQEKAIARQAEVGKEGKIKAGKNKRKATIDDKDEDAAGSAKRVNVAEAGIGRTSNTTSELHTNHGSHNIASASSSGSDTPALESKLNPNVKPAKKSPHIPHIPPTFYNADIVADHALLSKNVPSAPSTKVPKAREKAKIIKKPAAVPITTLSNSRPQAVAKSTSSNVSSKIKAKTRTTTLSTKNTAKPFKALIRTKPIQPPIPVSRIQDIPIIDLTTPTARIEYLETHFLNSTFIKLHRHRAKPITGPCYPTPLSFSKSSKLPQISHLAFQGLHPDIYFKIDSEGFHVVLRFWIARMHSYMQLGAGEAWSANAGGMGMMGSDMATWPPIMGVERVSEEIWAISTEEERGEVRYLVIGEIGEVVASSRGSGVEGGELVSGCRLRNDWARYLTASSRKKLEATVKTKDSYEFPSGVARAWSAKQREGMLKIARRAVLASCALSSFSGDKVSSIVMDAAHIGRPATGGVASNDLDFYLPENFQILSVHLPSGLHPALAIVQRGSGFSEFILAETGQMVGLEDDGVVSLWQGLLGCDAKGKAVENGHAEFWKRWESRMKLI